VVLEGESLLLVDGQQHLLTEGGFLYVPRGVARKLRSASGGLAYLSFLACRPCLMPVG
jgi:glyoxylate utilization-related uncharacterized protein